MAERVAIGASPVHQTSCMPHLLAVGYGYSARRVGERLMKRGWEVTGTRRSSDGRDELEEVGVRPLVFDGKVRSPDLGHALQVATHLLVSAAPDQGGDALLRHHRADLVASDALEWIGYLSTTGVYGDHGGAVVAEDTPVSPRTERSRRRLEAERAWEEVAAEAGVDLQVFRLTGIYGPGRSAFDRLRRGSARRLVRPGLVSNRIHVDDIAGAVIAGIEHPERTGVFNVTDDLPTPPGEVVEHAASLIGVEPPPEMPVEEADLSPMARSFYDENKRVDNRRLKTELGYTLRYPTYRQGLPAVLEGGG